MSTYMLSCCSTVDLNQRWLSNRGISSIYFNYKLGDEWLKDDFGASVSPADLYRRMLAGEPATTSQVSVGDYIDYFTPALEAGEDIVHVTLSSGLSGTYTSACLAADQLKARYPDRGIHIVDSLCASAGYGLLMDRLADLKHAGMGASELAAWATEHRLEVNHLFFSSDLTFYVRGGRVSPLAGAVGNILKVCPLLHVATDGTLQLKEKVRTKARAKRRMVERMAELVSDGASYRGKVFISQSECMSDARDVADAVLEACPDIDGGEVHIFDVGATIGCHTGPGTVALFFWGVPSRW